LQQTRNVQIIHPYLDILRFEIKSIFSSLNNYDIERAAWILYWFIHGLEKEIKKDLKKEREQLREIWSGKINIKTHPSLRPAAEMQIRQMKAAIVFGPIFDKVMDLLHDAGYFLQAKAKPVMVGYDEGMMMVVEK